MDGIDGDELKNEYCTLLSMLAGAARATLCCSPNVSAVNVLLLLLLPLLLLVFRFFVFHDFLNDVIVGSLSDKLNEF